MRFYQLLADKAAADFELHMFGCPSNGMNFKNPSSTRNFKDNQVEILRFG